MHRAGWQHGIPTDAEGELFSKGSLHFKVTAGAVIERITCHQGVEAQTMLF